MAISKGKKALLHVAKSKTGLSDTEYRDLLSSEGVTSAADPEFTDQKFDRIMQRFKTDYGFVSNRKKRYQPPKSKERLMAKIYAIRTELHLTESYVDAMAQNMFGAASFRWLNPQQLHKLVAAMSYHQVRTRNGKKQKAGPCT